MAISAPAYSINLVNLNTFNSIGDVTSNNTVIYSGSLNTVETSGGTGSLEDFLGIDPTNFSNAILDNTSQTNSHSDRYQLTTGYLIL
ncbi:hypothetical protein [Dolichospermum compactum]|nr:hypothetical protein [Dolichospermum compactum]